MAARLLLGVLLASLALVAAGCGKKQPTATEWANDFCGAVSTWRDSLQTAASSVTSSSVSKEAIQGAANDATTATDDFVSTIKKLGKPRTNSGDQAQQEVNDLSDEIDAGTQSMKDAVNNVQGVTGLLTAASAVTSTLATMSKQVQTTYENLRELDPKGELQNAFHEADACKNLKS